MYLESPIHEIILLTLDKKSVFILGGKNSCLDKIDLNFNLILYKKGIRGFDVYDVFYTQQIYFTAGKLRPRKS